MLKSPLSVPGTEILPSTLVHPDLPASLTPSNSWPTMLNQEADWLGLQHERPSFMQDEMSRRVERVPSYF